MTIFRSKKNGLLYLISEGRRWIRDLRAEPYGHSTPAPGRKIKLTDFAAVAYR